MASWAKPISLRSLAVGLVARAPASVQTKLLVAFLTIVGCSSSGRRRTHRVSGINDRTDELIRLQRKIAAYRQVQHDTTGQLYGISTALLFADDGCWMPRCGSSTSSAMTSTV